MRIRERVPWWKRTLTGATVVLLGSILVPPVVSRVLVLDPDTGPYRTFAECWPAARPGDTLEVAPGTYRELLRPNKSLFVRSRSGPERTFLDGESRHRIVYAQDIDLAIQGFTFQHGLGGNRGGAIYLGGDLTLLHCRFRDNHTASGIGSARGGAVWTSGLCEIDSCRFVANGLQGSSSGAGGAVYAQGGLRATHSTFLSNDAILLSAIFARPWLQVRNCIFADRAGGASLFTNLSYDQQPDTACNLYWNGRSPAAMGSWGPDKTAEPQMDPRLCPGEESLHESSPALSQLGDCGPIGELPVGCHGLTALAVRPRLLQPGPAQILRVYGYGLDASAEAWLIGPSGQEVPAAAVVAEGVWVTARFDLSEQESGTWVLRLSGPDGSAEFEGLRLVPYEVRGWLDGWVGEADVVASRIFGRDLPDDLRLTLVHQETGRTVPVTTTGRVGPDSLLVQVAFEAAEPGVYDLWVEPDTASTIGMSSEAPLVVPAVVYWGEPYVIRVPADWPTVVAAVEVAPPGSEIRVSSGGWPGGLILDKPLRVVGVATPYTPRLEAGSGRAIDVRPEAGSLTEIRNLIIGGGRVTDGPGGDLRSEVPVLLDSCMIFNSTVSGAGARGGLVYAVGARIRHCRFFGGSASSAILPATPWSLEPQAGGAGGQLFCFDCTVEDCRFEGGEAMLGGCVVTRGGRFCRNTIAASWNPAGARWTAGALQGEILDNQIENYCNDQPVLWVEGPSRFEGNAICDLQWDMCPGWSTFLYSGSLELHRNTFGGVSTICLTTDPVAEPTTAHLRMTDNNLDLWGAYESGVRFVLDGLDEGCETGALPEPRVSIPAESLSIHCNRGNRERPPVFVRDGREIECDSCIIGWSEPVPAGCPDPSEAAIPDCPAVPVLLLDHGVEARGSAARLWWRVNADMTLLGYEIVRSVDGTDTLLTPTPLPGCQDCEYTDPRPPTSGRVVYKLGVLTSDVGREWYELGEWSASVGSRGITLPAPSPHPLVGAGMLRLRLGRSEARVRLEIFDLSGRLVARLWDGPMEAGDRAIAWDGRSDSGRPLASGVYQLRAAAGLQRTSRKLLLLH